MRYNNGRYNRGHVVAFSVSLLSLSMLTGIAVADAFSESRFCRKLERRLERCDRLAQRNTHLGRSRWRRAFCDGIEKAVETICAEPETLLASESADGAVLDLLRKDYDVVAIDDAGPSVFPKHLIIGPADLQDPKIITLLRQAHRAGKSVAIANANDDDAHSFHHLLRAGQAANCSKLEEVSSIPLYGLQRAVTRAPGQNSSYCMLSLNDRDPIRDRRWLRDRFAQSPPQPQAGELNVTDSNSFLSDLANATHCSFKFTNQELGSVENDLYTYTMRNFSDTGCGSCSNMGADYYLVQESASFTPSITNNSVNYNLSARRPSVVSNTGTFTEDLAIEFADPATVTTFESGYSNDSSVTVDASVGFSSEKGVDVSGGASVTVGKSTSYSVPPTTILQQTDLTTAEPDWDFQPQTTTTGVTFGPVTTTWVWFAPRDAYPPGDGTGGTGNGQITFSSGANIFSSSTNTDVFNTCNVPFPFSAWTVAPPQLSMLNPTSASINGGVFTIFGNFLYPSSVSAVLIGGTSVPLATNVDLKSNTEVEVTVGGGTFNPGTNKVQVNTQFNGTNRFSNNEDLDLTN